MKYLFIGGPADGRRDVMAEPQETVYVYSTSELSFSEPWPTDEPRTYIYHRYRFGQSTVYLYTRLTPSEAMEILIRRYPQPL